MKTKPNLVKVLSLILALGILATCSVSYAQISKLGNRTARQSETPYVTDQSDPTPSVRIRMHIQNVAQNIEVYAYDQKTAFDMAETAGGGGGGAPRIVASPVTISKQIDQLTPLLNQIHLGSQHLNEVKLEWFRVDPSNRSETLFFTIKLTDVVISAIHRSLANQQDPAFARIKEVEAVSLIYDDMQLIAASAE
jgi:type VI secretion system Hcp family effector